MPGIYVEIDIRCSMEDLWERTQTPELHQQWDLRFTDIEYLPRPDPEQPQRFLYKTRIGFGLNVSGEGESVGTRESNGSRSSALKFWSTDWKSLIRQGSGYWQYIPLPNGIRFLTWYDYSTRFGVAGRLLDSAAFRPMLGWATAWSFDRLRLWLENTKDPAESLRQSLIYSVSRAGVAFVWIYHGLFPKLLFPHQDEFNMLIASGVPAPNVGTAAVLIGVGETALGLLMLIAWQARSLFVVTIMLMIVALLSVAVTAPNYLIAAFNPVTLNILI
ncbi:MAG TPA: DoxX-like family protein, partial [Terriglobia bacterium]|nr:DoxX-like family protein [Terriglobia bacterium]